MSVDLYLVAPPGERSPRDDIADALRGISAAGPLTVELDSDGIVVRRRLAAGDPNAVFLHVNFDVEPGNGEVHGIARGDSIDLLYWCFCSLADVLGWEVGDPQEAKPPHSSWRLTRRAIRLIDTYEKGVLAARTLAQKHGDGDGR